MKRRAWFFGISLMVMCGFLLTGSGLAYYYPPSNIPPGPPPNYNQVDTTYFLGTPVLPEPGPRDSGGFYVYYDQGSWNIVNHIYSTGGSLEQFHCCILAIMSQPPTLGVNVFIEEFEFWGDTTNKECLKQNDRWGWIPWGDSLYEIWWDVTIKEWKNGEGDPNDFIRFRITGCAVDFNLWSSGHSDFGLDNIWLGANKTPLSSVPGFTDTYPGIDDPYGDPKPNTTIFTYKNDTLRSYNKNGLIDSTDSYSCDLALQYGERYAGSFAYEGNGVEFSTAPFCPPNQNPNIFITPDTSVFLCSGDSVRIWILASDPDADDTITVEKIYGIGTYAPQTDLTPISDQFYFHPYTDDIYMFIFRVTDEHGATDEDTTFITVSFNQPPQLTCPPDDSVHAGDTFVSGDFSVSDPDANLSLVEVLDISPTPTNMPIVVDNHIELVTTCADCAESGIYTIGLVATDSCDVKDTCYFEVTVYNEPPVLTCPEDDSVHAGETLISTDFSVSDPDGDSAPITLLDIAPSATNDPTIVDNHAEWLTTCDDLVNGPVFTITLVVTDPCGAEDTCDFTVTVYNLPPQITCPDDDSVYAGDYFTSTNFSVSDPKAEPVTVALCGVDPAPVNQPIKVETHVEWQTECADAGNVFTICLEATDSCGAKDTCYFQVTVYNQPPVLTCPDDDSVKAGDLFTSTDFSVSDPEGDPTSVAFLDITPTATNTPTIVDSHVVWVTTCDEDGDYVIRLIATDSCGAKDTCEFTVNVYNQPPVLTCPDDDSVKAGDLFTSTDFSVSDPEGDPTSVAFLDITPTATNTPTIVDSHVVWVTTCDEDGDYIIRLMATDSCGAKDTCEFTVSVSQGFTISAAPDTQYVTGGQAVGYKVKLTDLCEFDDPCTLFVSGLPNPPDSGVFDTTILTPTDSTILNVYTSAQTDTGWYTLIIVAQRMSGASGGLQHGVEVVLRVEEPSDAGDWTDNPNAPKSFTLFQNQPNPFNPETKISYYLAKACQVRLTIYNVLGQRVKTLFDGHQDVGTQTLLWDGRGDDGVQLSSGIYFYRLQAANFHQTKKMILMK